MAANTDDADLWVYAGEVPSRFDWVRLVRELLTERGLERPNDEDIRIDPICTRDASLESRMRVMVRRVPTPLPARKKARRLP